MNLILEYLMLDRKYILIAVAVLLVFGIIEIVLSYKIHTEITHSRMWRGVTSVTLAILILFSRPMISTYMSRHNINITSTDITLYNDDNVCVFDYNATNKAITIIDRYGSTRTIKTSNVKLIRCSSYQYGDYDTLWVIVMKDGTTYECITSSETAKETMSFVNELVNKNE